MSSKTPIRTVFNDSNVATGLAEFQSGEFIPLSHGGIGAALSIGSAGQVLKVNSGASALEFGNVEAIVNIDGATNLESATLVVGDKILLSDGGSEGRVLLSQLDTLFSGTTKTLTNKTLTTPIISSISNTGTITLPTSTDTLVGRATTDTLTNKTVSGASNTLSNIGNSSLSNSAVTVGTTSISLGGSATTIAGVSDLTAGSINIAGNVIKSNDSTVVEIGGGDGLSVAGNMTVTGNLTVSGSTTTVSSTNTTLADQFIELGTGRSGSASGDSGIVIERGSDANAFIGFDESADEFSVGTGTFTGSSTGNLTITKGTFSSAGNRIYNGTNYVALEAPSLGGNVTLTLPANDGSASQVLITDGSGNLSFTSVSSAAGAGLSNVVDDTSPELGGNLDINGNDIVSTSNGNIDILPNGTGVVNIDGNGSSGGVTISDGSIDIRTGTGSIAQMRFFCESSNAHAQTLKAQPHSASSSSVLTLPAATGTLIGTGDSGTVSNTMLAGSIANAKLSNSTITIQDDSSTQDAVALGETLIFEGGSGVTTTVTDNKVSIATDGSIVTETSTDTLTNKSLNFANNTFTTTLALLQTAVSDATLVDLDDSQTLTNKTLTTPIIASLRQASGTNLLTMPAATDTLVGRATTDTLTNKTLTSPKINEDVAVTATATEINLLDGVTATTAELNHTDGVTSNIQTQIDSKTTPAFAIAQAVALG